MTRTTLLEEEAVAFARDLIRIDTVNTGVADLVLAFLADEESGGVWGAGWLVEHRPDLFAGVSETLGEVGRPSRRSAPTGSPSSRRPPRGGSWTCSARHGGSPSPPRRTTTTSTPSASSEA